MRHVVNARLLGPVREDEQCLTAVYRQVSDSIVLNSSEGLSYSDTVKKEVLRVAVRMPSFWLKSVKSVNPDSFPVNFYR